MQNNRNTEVTLSTISRNGKPSRIINWVAEQHWWVIGLVSILLLSFETYDFTRTHYDFIHIIEFAIYMSLLLVVGFLVDLLMREIHIQSQTKKILDIKHKLSLEFSGYHDWNVLVDHIARFPSTIAPVGQACLIEPGTVPGQFTSVAQWNCEEEDIQDLYSTEQCQKCITNELASEVNFCQCESESTDARSSSRTPKFCLPIRYGGKILGILMFKLELGKSLTEEQVDTFQNIGDDIANVLKVGQERKVFYEIRTSETALAERRSVSHYLHDHLGQSLGYLHIKMDQLIEGKNQLTFDNVYQDLEQMRGAVNDSYEIVRGILETIHSETAPVLTNLLLEHAKKISQRANFEIEFKTKGKPLLFPTEVQQAIFYAFEESLSNAEKHAKASKIDILAEWGQDYFRLTISDNGIGFDPQSVDTDGHFGMEILNERMAKVNGRITLTTSENSGTVVNIHVPKPSGGQLGAGI